MSREKRNVTIKADSRISRADSDEENIVYSVDGTIEDDGEKITVSYTEPTGDDGTQTKSVLSFSKENRGEVTVSRSGGIQSLMVFEVGRRYNWQYDIGILSMDFCTTTIELVNTIDEKGGHFSVYYVMESRGIEMQKVLLKLSVK